jgi:hypothetical protein
MDCVPFAFSMALPVGSTRIFAPLSFYPLMSYSFDFHYEMIVTSLILPSNQKLKKYGYHLSLLNLPNPVNQDLALGETVLIIASIITFVTIKASTGPFILRTDMIFPYQFKAIFSYHILKVKLFLTLFCYFLV